MRTSVISVTASTTETAITVRSSFTTSVRVTLVLAAALFLLVAAQTAGAGETVRDHRGANEAPQGGVTVNGQPAKVTAAPELGGPKYKGFRGLTGVGGKGPRGATVRDHR